MCTGSVGGSLWVSIRVLQGCYRQHHHLDTPSVARQCCVAWVDGRLAWLEGRLAWVEGGLARPVRRLPALSGRLVSQATRTVFDVPWPAVPGVLPRVSVRHLIQSRTGCWHGNQGQVCGAGRQVWGRCGRHSSGTSPFTFTFPAAARRRCSGSRRVITGAALRGA